MEEENKLLPFEGKPIRKIWHDEQWYFSVVDVIEVLTDSPKPTAYWNKVAKNLNKESQFYPFWIKLKMAEIAKATFGLTPSEHKMLKNLGKQNLRDHMTRLELIFTALGEELSRDQSVRLEAKGFEEN
jgi:prophage antirepressor-like protein